MSLPALAPALKVVGIATVSSVIALAIDPTVFAGAIAFVIAAVTTATVTILSKLGENRKSARADALVASEAAGEITLKLATIEHSVDGAATKSVAKIDQLEQRVEELIRQLADARDTASTLAATTAATIPGVATARAEGKAEGVELERARGERKP